LLAQTTLDQVDVAQLWHPILDLTNIRKNHCHPSKLSPLVRTRHQPLAAYAAQRDEFSSLFDLQHFPLDHHTLTLELESAEYDSDALTFAYLYATTDAPGQEYKLQPGRHVALDALPLWLANPTDRCPSIPPCAPLRPLHLVVLPDHPPSWASSSIPLLERPCFCCS
jgi:hypothetical protein